MASPRQTFEKAFSLLQEALQDSESRANALDEQLRRRKPSKSQLEEKLDVLIHRLEAAEQESERWKREAGQLEELVANERAKIAQLKKKLNIAESGPDKPTKKEINFWRAKGENFDRETREYKNRITSLREEIDERGRKLTALQDKLAESEARAPQRAEERRATEEKLNTLDCQIRSLENALTEAHSAKAELTADLDALRQQLQESRKEQATQQRNQQESRSEAARIQKELTQRDGQLAELSAQLEKARAQSLEGAKELTRARVEAETAAQDREKITRSLEQLSKQLQTKESELESMAARQSESQSKSNGAREQIASLKTELREQEECTENLTELANERLDKLSKLEEQLEEAQERYEESQWRLGRAQHFERLVERRKGLIASLIGALRTKTKANFALKAGLDSLRKFKATSQGNQQKLLAQIDQLKAELGAAQQTMARHQGATLAQEELVESNARTIELENRLNTQAELMQSLEEELKKSKIVKRDLTDRDSELRRLEEELEKKTEIIDRLQLDVDTQQKRLSKLRGSDSETMRLKACAEKDQSMIDALEREIAQLRDSLARHADSAASGGQSTNDHELQVKLEEREEAFNQLLEAMKEREFKIEELSETVESWKRKYEFLSAEAPEAYQAALKK